MSALADHGHFTYTPFNKISSATDGSLTETFTYGPKRQRETATRSDGTSTVYVSELFRLVFGETLNPKLINQVVAGDRVVAEVEKRRGFGTFVNEDVRFILDDNLGSPQVVADDGGTVLQEMSFDAWGAPRNADWLTAGGYINIQDVTVGYTGHEEEQTLGLTNMRGRMYDPELGRFTTPDPYIETPYVGAGMNRFSYVLNSPTNTTDPTGFYGNPQGQCDVNCGGGGGIQLAPLGGGIAIPILSRLVNYKNGTTGAIKAKAKSQLQREGASSVGQAGAPSEPNGTASGENGARFLAWAQTLEEPSADFVFTSLKLALGMGGWLSFMPHYVINNYVQEPYDESEGVVGESFIAVAGSDAYGVAVHSEPHHDELQRAEPTLAALQMVAVATSAAAGAEVGAQALTKQLNKLVRKYGMKRGRFRFGKKKPKPASSAKKGGAGADVGKKISQKQNRHIAGRKEYRGGGYLDSFEDAQGVLDAYHSGAVEVLGASKQGFPVVKVEGITGTNVNVGAGISGQPTNVFMIKGTSSPSVVPLSPKWKP